MGSCSLEYTVGILLLRVESGKDRTPLIFIYVISSYNLPPVSLATCQVWFKSDKHFRSKFTAQEVLELPEGCHSADNQGQATWMLVLSPWAGLATRTGHSCRPAPPCAPHQCAGSRLFAVRARQTDSMAAGYSWKDATVARDVSIVGRT
ncbi:hypothetical protein Q8A73_022217 [Channa argus]|nr:hypothetical protein Q8A73_022217 [Channa argus]